MPLKKRGGGVANHNQLVVAHFKQVGFRKIHVVQQNQVVRAQLAAGELF